MLLMRWLLLLSWLLSWLLKPPWQAGAARCEMGLAAHGYERGDGEGVANVVVVVGTEA